MRMKILNVIALFRGRMDSNEEFGDLVSMSKQFKFGPLDNHYQLMRIIRKLDKLF